MILRGTIIQSVKTSKEEKKPHVGRIAVRFDMTTELATRMGWDCLFDVDGKPTNGWDTLPLKGDIAVVSAKFRPNNKKSGMGEVTATGIGGFAAHRVKEKGEDGTRLYISATILSSDENFETIMGPYWRGLNDGGSQLTLREAQASLFPPKEEDDDEDVPLTGEAAKEHQTLASAAEAKRRAKAN